ncbi:MAG TPA: hypothetical protein VIK13_03630 [Candidatus Limnocylindrales bacterium]
MEREPPGEVGERLEQPASGGVRRVRVTQDLGPPGAVRELDCLVHDHARHPHGAQDADGVTEGLECLSQVDVA